MAGKTPPIISRRTALAGLAAGIAAGRGRPGARAAEGAGAEVVAAPVFSSSGPNADIYGAAENFPIKDPALPFIPGNPLSRKYRVGAFSHFDELYPTRQVNRAAGPWLVKRGETPDAFRERATDYLSRNPVNGLLIAKDDRILFEHYQYGRTDRDLLISQSTIKSVTGILIGIAISEGAIKSVEDTAETYVAGFRGSEYGKTPIRDLLHMSSGVEFGQENNDERDLNLLWIDMIMRGESIGKGTIGSITQFNRRTAPAGTKFSYASIEADVLAVVLRHATNKTLSDYLHQKVWSRIGTEADAKWLIDAQGLEVAHFGFNAVLRDYARLGRLLAHDGAWEGEQIVPAQWLMDATTVRASDSYLLPGKAMAPEPFGYGYLLWLLPGTRRQFALVGAFGQRICIDPASKLVMVQTAVENTPEVWRLWSAAVEQFSNA